MAKKNSNSNNNNTQGKTPKNHAGRQSSDESFSVLTNTNTKQQKKERMKHTRSYSTRHTPQQQQKKTG